MRELECELRELKKEKAELITEHDAIEVEREEEMRALQNALDSGLELRIKIQNKFEQDFKALRNSYSSQEQQLMDDFEWKLRQIECTCKAKLREKDVEVIHFVLSLALRMLGVAEVYLETKRNLWLSHAHNWIVKVSSLVDAIEF